MGKAGEGEPSLLTFPIGPQAPPHSFLWWVVPPLAWPALPKIPVGTQWPQCLNCFGPSDQ